MRQHLVAGGLLLTLHLSQETRASAEGISSCHATAGLQGKVAEVAKSVLDCLRPELGHSVHCQETLPTPALDCFHGV